MSKKKSFDVSKLLEKEAEISNSEISNSKIISSKEIPEDNLDKSNEIVKKKLQQMKLDFERAGEKGYKLHFFKEKYKNEIPSEDAIKMMYEYKGNIPSGPLSIEYFDKLYNKELINKETKFEFFDYVDEQNDQKILNGAIIELNPYFALIVKEVYEMVGELLKPAKNQDMENYKIKYQNLYKESIDLFNKILNISFSEKKNEEKINDLTKLITEIMIQFRLFSKYPNNEQFIEHILAGFEYWNGRREETVEYIKTLNP